MNPWINYHHLFYFKTIAEEESVSKAAARLRLGQPTLSAQLKQFEDSLGVRLFERQHKRLILTEQGRVALEYARNIFKLGSEMYEVLHDQLLPQRHTVTIGALDSIAKQIILQLVEKALRSFPCQVSLVEGKSDELLRELTNHRIDLLITNFIPTVTASQGLFHRVVSKKTVSVFAAPKFKMLRKNFPKSISGQPFILPTYDSRLRFALDHWSKSERVAFDVVAESQDIAVKKLMAISGIGLIPAASHAVNRQVLSGELLEIGEMKGVTEELVLVTAERKIRNVVAAKLMAEFAV